MCKVKPTFWQGWSFMICWIFLKEIEGSTMMMSLSWLYHLKEGFGDLLDNIIQRENKNSIDELTKKNTKIRVSRNWLIVFKQSFNFQK